MNSPEWRVKRHKRLVMDLGICMGVVVEKNGKKHLCLSRERLEVHHLSYARLGREELSDLITLCHECHKAVHKHKQEKQNGKR
jgi:5-methylcytosine-specific restriction endonuclease McrA